MSNGPVISTSTPADLERIRRLLVEATDDLMCDGDMYPDTFTDELCQDFDDAANTLVVARRAYGRACSKMRALLDSKKPA